MDLHEFFLCSEVSMKTAAVSYCFFHSMLTHVTGTCSRLTNEVRETKQLIQNETNIGGRRVRQGYARCIWNLLNDLRKLRITRKCFSTVLICYFLHRNYSSWMAERIGHSVRVVIESPTVLVPSLPICFANLYFQS